MMNNLVSVIIPVYNSEPYLKRCLNSVLAQSYENIEVLLIDDGSTDNSSAICDKFADKDNRVKVIHQKNLGAAAARNTGLDNATGDYIMFCDSDDIVSYQWVEHLVLPVINSNRIVMPFSSICNDKNFLGTNASEITKVNSYINKLDLYQTGINNLIGYDVITVFLKSILDRETLRFRNQKEKADYNEDLLFVTTYLDYVDGFVYSGYMDYCYLTREDSLSRAVTPYYFEKYEEKYEIFQKLIKKYGDEADRKECASYYLYHFLLAYKDAVKKNNYSRFKEIVESKAVQNCLEFADTSKDDNREINLLRVPNARLLWFYNKLLVLRRR